MHIYHIVQIYNNQSTLDLTVLDDRPERRNISLKKNKRVSQFKTGKDIIVLRDFNLDMEDVVYICDGQLYLNQRPHTPDKYGCQCLIDYVAGWENEHSFDRDLFKLAIERECVANKIPLAHEKPDSIATSAAVNLLNLITKAKGY